MGFFTLIKLNESIPLFSIKCESKTAIKKNKKWDGSTPKLFCRVLKKVLSDKIKLND